MKLHFNKLGEGPALIILHGLYGSGDNWFNIAKALAQHFTVYLVDQRNHGNSPHEPAHSYEDMSKDLEELIASENIDNLIIIGHSMGGKTAMTFTLQHGEMVNKLINVDISPFSYEGLEHFTDQYKYHQAIIERFENAPVKNTDSRSDIEDYFAEKIKNTSTRRFLLKNLKRNKNEGFSWKLNIETISKSLDNIIDAAPPIKIGAQSYVDTLFIRGGQSPYISDEDLDGIKDIFPNSSFLTYEKSGHWLHSEETERFVKDIKEYLL